MTTAGTEAQTYLAQVRAALADLPPVTRDDLLEDLPGHLAETLAETGGPLERSLGTPQAYAAELRASAGLPAAPVGAVRYSRLAQADRAIGAAVLRSARRARAAAAELPYGRQVQAFLPELQPGWWVLRGYLLVAVPAALGVLGLGLGVPPLVTLLGSDLLGLLLTVAAVVASVRLGRRTAVLPVEGRRLVLVGNVLLVGLCAVAGIGLRQQIGYNDQIVYAADTSFLQGPNGGISNIYAFDSAGRPLEGVQLFDQDGQPLDTLLLQAPDGSYAEPVRALDEYGNEVRNVFPRTLRAEVYGPEGSRLEPVRPPAIAPRRLASPSASPSPSATPSPAGPPALSPSGPPPASGSPSPAPAPAPASPSPAAVPAPAPSPAR